MKSLKLAILFIIAALVIGVVAFVAHERSHKGIFTIHFVNYRGHTPVDAGFEYQLKQYNINYEIVYHDIDRNPERLGQVRKYIKGDKNADLVVTWGTTVSLGIFGPIGSTDNTFITEVPGIFVLVTDPVAVGLVTSLDNPNRNLTGSWHVAPMTSQFQTMMAYRPAQKIGVLYTPTEKNSVAAVESLKKLAQSFGIEVIAIPFVLQQGLPVATNAVDSLKLMKDQQVEWLYLPPDSFLGQQARDLVIPSAHALGIATFASTEQLMQAGASFGLICPYLQLGQLVGEKAKKILVDEISAADIPMDTIPRFHHQVNLTAIEMLGITIPASMLKSAEKISAP